MHLEFNGTDKNGSMLWRNKQTGEIHKALGWSLLCMQQEVETTRREEAKMFLDYDDYYKEEF